MKTRLEEDESVGLSAGVEKTSVNFWSVFDNLSSTEVAHIEWVHFGVQPGSGELEIIVDQLLAV